MTEEFGCSVVLWMIDTVRKFVVAADDVQNIEDGSWGGALLPRRTFLRSKSFQSK